MWSDHILKEKEKEKEKEKKKSSSMQVLDLFLCTPLTILLFKSFYLMTFISKALWLHRRFLSLCWMKQFATNLHDVSSHSELKISTSNSFNSFIDNELHLLNSCSTIPDNDFEDFQAQATYSATYILWLTKVNYLLSF